MLILPQMVLGFPVQVDIELRVLYRPVPDQLPTVYRGIGEDIGQKILPSIVQETLKAVVAQHNASELLTQREVSNKVFSFDIFICKLIYI